MQIQSLIRRATEVLQHVTSSPQLEAELLLGHVLQWTRTQIITHSLDTISHEVEVDCWELVQRRAQGEPIAYLLGYREFWSLLLKVTPATLIPRPETELLVELALKLFSSEKVVRLADLGTGSGAIALAMASERPHWKIVATDNSPAALTVATDNAQRLGITQVDFRLGDWCSPLGDEPYDLIISNPPYIAADDQHLRQGDLRFEPHSALIAAQEGLHDLNIIITQARQHLVSEGYLLLEHGYDQGTQVAALLRDQGYSQITQHLDLAGNSRVVRARF